MKTKLHDNPYQTKHLDAFRKLEKERNKAEQEVIIVMAEIGFALLGMGIIFLWLIQ